MHTQREPEFHRRRFSDAVSPLNDGIHDKARLLAQAVEMVDRLGLHILMVEADASASRNNRILVAPSAACNELGGVECGRSPGASHWCATRFGVEIWWVIRSEEAA